MFKKLSSITGAVLLAAVAATITAKRTPDQTVRHEPIMQTNEANRRRETAALDLARYIQLANNMRTKLQIQQEEAEFRRQLLSAQLAMLQKRYVASAVQRQDRQAEAHRQRQLLAAQILSLQNRYSALADEQNRMKADQAILSAQRQEYTYPATNTIPSQMEWSQNADNLAKAKLLRDEWHRWAMQHREELRQMLQASGTDQATLTRVYNLLVSMCELHPGDCMARFMEHQNDYSWQIVSGLRSVTQVRDEAVLHDFIEYRDIKLLVFDPGLKNDLHVEYVLWASGRVTKNGYSGYNSLYRDSLSGGRLTLNNGSASFNTSNGLGSSLHADNISLTYNIFPPYEELTR